MGKWTIAQAPVHDKLDDTPDRRSELVWVEGTVTADYGNFYDMLCVRADSGAVGVYAPVAGLSDALTLGSQVRVVAGVVTVTTTPVRAWHLTQSRWSAR